MKVLPRCYVCCLLLLVIAGTGGRNILRSADRHNVSSLTMTHVIDQTEPLCREFFPDHDTLRFVASPSPAFLKNGKLRHLWAVDCLDAQGNRLIYALWDEDRKQLVQIGRGHYLRHRFMGDFHKPTPRLSAPQALRTARDWAVRLHLAKWEEVESSRNLLRCFNNIVNVNFYLPSHSIRVAMADSGEVRGVFVSGISEPSVSGPSISEPSVPKPPVPKPAVLSSAVTRPAVRASAF
jgi:hypothetical protein